MANIEKYINQFLTSEPKEIMFVSEMGDDVKDNTVLDRATSLAVKMYIRGIDEFKKIEKYRFNSFGNIASQTVWEQNGVDIYQVLEPLYGHCNLTFALGIVNDIANYQDKVCSKDGVGEIKYGSVDNNYIRIRRVK